MGPEYKMNPIITEDKEVKPDSSNVFFVDSDVFGEGLVKMIVSPVSAEDIISAHKNVYEESGEFKIREQLVLSDKALFTKHQEIFRKSLHLEDSKTFYNESQVETLKKLVQTVNDLYLLVGIQVEPTVEHMHMVSVIEEVEYGSFATLMSEDEKFLESASEVVSQTTKMLELKCRTEDPVETSTPIYKRFIVLNNDCNYKTHIFGEVFPEFDVTEHDKFPKNKLAEEMLTLLSKGLGPGMDTSNIVKKICVFFDTSFGSCPVLFPPMSLSPPSAMLWNNGHRERLSCDLRGHPSELTSGSPAKPDKVEPCDFKRTETMDEVKPYNLKRSETMDGVEPYDLNMSETMCGAELISEY